MAIKENSGDEFQEFTKSEIETSIHERFERSLTFYATNPAIHSDRYQWSYSELSFHIDQVASAILSEGDFASTKVALLFDQDAPMVAGMLGALKAGKAYIPLDPSSPIKRLNYMILDVQARTIIACDATIELASKLVGDQINIINVDKPKAVSDQNFPDVSPYDTAYILYTSGSTGKPKGVVQNHRNVLHFIRNYTNSLRLTASDKLTLLSTYTFDAAVMDIYSAILNGACLFPKSVAKDGFASIAPWIKKHEISIYHSTPTVYRYSIGSGEAFPSIRYVVLGGEAVVRSDVELYRQSFPKHCVMMNLLGATESSFTLQNIIDIETEIQGRSVSVGRAIEDTEVYLIDRGGNISNTEGEIVFKSEHVLIEYWNRPELTKAVLTVDSQDAQIRAYHTGDLGRWRKDGSLEFLGRKDFQVKIHGIRIELGEIEATLRGIQGVQQAVVVAQPRSSQNIELVAYIIKEGNSKLEKSRIKDELAKELPAFMCPSTMVELDSYPLTRTGKIDRKSFPKPQPTMSSLVAGAVKSETETQQALIDIWTDLLAVDDIGIDDNFFDLGGDSLVAVRFCDTVRERLGYSLSLVNIFKHRTIRALADVMEDDQEDDGTIAQLVPLNQHQTPGGAQLFCICGINLYRALAKAIGEPHSIFGVFLPIEQEMLSTGVNIPSVEEMATMYREVIQKKQLHGPYRLAGLSFGGVLAYELARQLRAAGEEVDVLVMFDSMLPNTIPITKRLTAHIKLALRYGSSYIIPKLAKAIKLRPTSKEPEFIDDNIARQDRAMAVMRGNIYGASVRAYRTKMPRYDGNATFFRALDCSEYRKVVDEPDCGWSQFVRGQLDALETPGGHITMLQQPNVTMIARTIRDSLDRAADR